jgi:hypothetical protein
MLQWMAEHTDLSAIVDAATILEGDASVRTLLPKQMTITSRMTELTISAEGLESPVCLDCRTRLDVHQPDEVHPEHLLGTCAGCGVWYLIEVGHNETEAYLIDLPNVNQIRAVMAAKKPAGTGKRPSK